MSWQGNEDPFEKPSDWFNHIDDSSPQPESERPRWQIFVAAFAMLMIVLLLAIPALQAAVLERWRDGLPDSAYDRTALLFATSLLQRRSTAQAMVFATDDAETGVREVIFALSNSPSPPTGARLAVRPSPCFDGDGDVDQCYEAILVHSGTEVSPGIVFGLAEIDDEPRVVFVRTTLQTARAAD